MKKNEKLDGLQGVVHTSVYINHPILAELYLVHRRRISNLGVSTLIKVCDRIIVSCLNHTGYGNE